MLPLTINKACPCYNFCQKQLLLEELASLLQGISLRFETGSVRTRWIAQSRQTARVRLWENLLGNWVVVVTDYEEGTMLLTNCSSVTPMVDWSKNESITFRPWGKFIAKNSHFTPLMLTNEMSPRGYYGTSCTKRFLVWIHWLSVSTESSRQK